MSRASEKTLDGIHEAVALVLQAGLQVRREPILNEDGEKIGEREILPSPQLIAQAIKFLSVNGINSPATSKRMTDLAAALEDLDLDEVEAHYPN